ncbi:MAG: helix-hairpin-helix domain-containing protein [Myxococcota bacterium]
MPTSPSGADTLLDVNTATAQQLEALPFIGVFLAHRIIDDREENGPFPSVFALTRVPGVRDWLVDQVKRFFQ